jgi:uncharacterized protein (TIGR00255 family)
MTGFGRASGPLSNRFSAAITVKTVNHRHLEISLRLPESIWEMEPSIRGLGGEFFTRGKVDLAIRVQRTSEPEYSIRVNSRVANAVMPQLRALLEEHGISQPLTGSDLMRVPDLLQVETSDAEWEESEQEALRALIRVAFGKVNEMRSLEGEGLRRDISQRLETIERQIAVVEQSRETITREVTDALRQRVSELARTAGAEVSDERIAQEVVMMLDRMDVAEELTRLRLHIEQTRGALDAKEPSGKKLDFLSQEMLREINTLGQKSRTPAIRSAVVELKTELERIREQVQNVE